MCVKLRSAQHREGRPNMSKEENNSELEEVAMQSITLSGEERKAAYAWLARRDGNTSAATEASFQRWLCDSPRNRRAYDEASRLWAMMGAPAAASVARRCGGTRNVPVSLRRPLWWRRSS